ncbi:unnamed protein product [Ilex paraguariensis]|uniref:Two-component response regulator-like PRR37 n=1 Tax=Ilex paraguariensis TaxID=185542 RepID=A0ABC8RGU7_9AQUA
MRGICVDTNGTATKGFSELAYRMRDQQKEVRGGIVSDGQGPLEEDESRINEDAEDINNGHIELLPVQVQVKAKAQAHDQDQAVLQRQQEQPPGPQGSVVHWEQFLPRRSLKVLLVENDDSTRHVVNALLRNCSYEVMAVANGLQAWKILEDSTNHIDIVLTEVVMPCLSGIGLLSKIMRHKTCNTIPVIMMSSNDSMGIVFKCLSKGAVDFLVKPIRKNELKNLWQHVWRKCHSSSGSGSESGIRMEKSTKSRSIQGSENNSGSNDEDDNSSVGLYARDGSDNGSGTQSSWSKRAVEVDSPLPMLPWDQLADPPDSTCAQVIYLMPEAFSNNWEPTTATGECHKHDDELEDVAMGKDLEIGVPGNSNLQMEDPRKAVLNSMAGTNKDMIFNLDTKKDNQKTEKIEPKVNTETANDELRNEPADLMGSITNGTTDHIESVTAALPNDLTADIKDKITCDIKDMPFLELGLKRERDVGDYGPNVGEHKVLRHSGLSAFSRYNTTSTANQTPTGNVGSCSPLDNSSGAAKTESMHNLQSNSIATRNQCSNGSSNNNDMGSTTNSVFTKPEVFSDKPMANSTVNVHPSSAFQPVQQSHNSFPQPVIQGKANAATVNTVLAQPRVKHQKVQVQHHHHHYHHYHHHVHNMQNQQQLPNDEDLHVKNIVSGSPQCRTSNVLGTLIEGNAANYGSASGSNNGSNGQNGSSAQNGSSGQNGSSTAVIAEGTNMVSDDGVAGNCGAAGGSGSGSGSRSGVDQNRATQREAALNKFRQKRKERCFEKKVRYQSRKRLAEQRPRVRGQFVRQAVNENKTNDSNCKHIPSA